jgi:hypothetical protein
MADLNEGWYFEGPDPSVGLFGDYVVHSDCPNVPDDEDVPEAAVTDTAYRTEGAVVTATTTYTCPACGATTAAQESYPAAHFEDH